MFDVYGFGEEFYQTLYIYKLYINFCEKDKKKKKVPDSFYESSVTCPASRTVLGDKGPH